MNNSKANIFFSRLSEFIKYIAVIIPMAFVNNCLST